MSISRYCIDRPIFAAVVSIVITIAGAVAMINLPIAQYPEITPVTVSVSAAYPGASADVVSNSVAAPMEQQINGADHMMYMESSSSSSGNTSITVYFDIGTSPELAQVDVQNRVSTAQGRLPAEVNTTGINITKSGNSFVFAAGFYAENAKYDPLFISNYLDIYLRDALKRVKGVGDRNRGERERASRVADDQQRTALQAIHPDACRQREDQERKLLEDRQGRDRECARVQDLDRCNRQREQGDLRAEFADRLSSPELEEVAVAPQPAGRPETF